MRNPGFQLGLSSFVGAILLALSAMVCAQPPANAPDLQQSKVSPPARTKPQVIYHVRPASNYAATLHSQQKTQNSDRPTESDMPASVPSPRPNANPEARAQQPAAVVERNQPRPKMQKSPGKRPQVPVKSKGPGGKVHGGKGHKH